MGLLKAKPKPKPQIDNFRIRWDKVADLGAMAAIWAGTVWIMVLLTVVAFHRL